MNAFTPLLQLETEEAKLKKSLDSRLTKFIRQRKYMYDNRLTYISGAKYIAIERIHYMLGQYRHKSLADFLFMLYLIMPQLREIMPSPGQRFYKNYQALIHQCWLLTKEIREKQLTQSNLCK